MAPRDSLNMFDEIIGVFLVLFFSCSFLNFISFLNHHTPFVSIKMSSQYVFKFDKFKPFSRSENGFFLFKVEFVVINLFCIIFFTLQLVEKDLNKAVPLFWSAINCGDRVDSAVKDMASVMKQANRADEAIEAIKSFRNRCSFQSQEALDNVLLDLYKVKSRCIRISVPCFTSLLEPLLYSEMQ